MQLVPVEARIPLHQRAVHHIAVDTIMFTCCMPYPSFHISFDYAVNVWWSVPISTLQLHIFHQAAVSEYVDISYTKTVLQYHSPRRPREGVEI